MESIKLGDVATYINGYAFKPEQRGKEGLPIIRIQDLTGNSYDLGFYNGDYPKQIEINSGDILISWSGSLGVYKWENGKALLNQHIFKVLFDKVNIDKDYYCLAVKNKLRAMAQKTHGATMKHITKKDFDNVTIPYPNEKEQRLIADTLLKVEKLKISYNFQLEDLDKLVKARFVEMFRDEKHRMLMSEVCSIITDGTHQPPKFKREGIPFIFVSNVAEDRLTYNAEKFIDQETYDELIKRTPIEIGDVLLSTVGSYGHPAVVKSEEKFLFQRHIAYLKPRREIVDSEFLHGAILSSDVQEQIEKAVKGIAQKTLNLSEIKKMVIPVPTMDRQKKFADFVQQVDKSKLAVQKSLEKTQLLFDSLMQEYFG